MIRLRAYHTYDASAVFESGGQLYFVEKPYTQGQTRINPSQLDYLLRRMEYTAAELEFQTLDQMEEEVRRIASAHRHQYPASKLSEEQLIRGYEGYSKEMLQFVLEDLRDSYVLTGKVHEANVLAEILWKVGRITSDPSLRELLVQIDREIKDACDPLGQIKNQPKADAFPHLKGDYAFISNLAAAA